MLHQQTMKKTVSIIMIFILIGLCFLSNVIVADPIENNKDEIIETIEHDDIISRGHGLGGLRGGIVFSPEDEQGFGYTDDEVLINIQMVYGDG